MVMWEIFRRKPRPLQKVTIGRFELERDGEVAYLEYSLSGDILELTHTEVPKKLRHMGLASSLAENALDWAREHNLKVDIVCSTVREYVATHPGTQILSCIDVMTLRAKKQMELALRVPLLSKLAPGRKTSGSAHLSSVPSGLRRPRHGSQAV